MISPLDRRYLDRFYEFNGGLLYIRALKRTPDGRCFSGYFDSVDALLSAVEPADGQFQNIALGLNPFRLECLDRGKNRLDDGRGPPIKATSSADITSRKFLTVDCDVKRSKNTSSTNEELAAAFERAKQVREYLRSLGWPEPALNSSGNGYHLVYRIDLPVDDGGLVGAVLKELDRRFGDDRVGIDTKLSDPARVVKLYGTTACKGDNTPERPHRRSGVISLPDEWNVVDEALLRSLATASADSAKGTPTPDSSGAPRASKSPPRQSRGEDEAGAAIDRVIAALGAHGCEPKQSANGKWTARCPAHDDQNPSLSLSLGNDGRVLVHCFAGCSADEVTRELGLTTRDLFDRPLSRGAARRQAKREAKTFADAEGAIAFYEHEFGKVHARFEYHDHARAIVLVVLRWDPLGEAKIIRPVSRRTDGLWVCAAPEGTRRLYALTDLREGDDPVIVVEGEAKCDLAWKLGFTATTSFGGAVAAERTDWSPLAGRSVVVLPDNDSAGRRYAASVARCVRALSSPARVRLLVLPALSDGGDIVDFVAAARRAGRSDAEIVTTVRKLIENATDAPILPALESESDGEAHAWDRIVSFDEGSWTPFPVEALGEQVSGFVKELAHALQVPVDLIALPALGIIGAAAAKRIEFEVAPGWTVPANLYVLVALPPGERKTASLSGVSHPLSEWERAKALEMGPEAADAQRRLKLMLARAKSLASAFAKKGGENSDLWHQANDAQRAVDEFQAPVPPRLRVDDTTPEQLSILMSMHGGRIACITSEGGFIENFAGRYSEGVANLDLFLKGWDGADPYTRDRVTATSLCINRPTITLVLTIQPDVVQSMASKPGFRGRGVLARFLYSFPASRVGRRLVGTKPVSEEHRARWGDLVANVLNWPDERDANNEIATRRIRFSDQARELLAQFERELEPRLGSDGELDAITEWASKLSGTTARIAGLLEVIDANGRMPTAVGTVAVERAIAIAHYLIEHAKAAYAVMGADPDIENAKHLLKWIQRSKLTAFSARDALEGMRRRSRKSKDVAATLEALIAHGYIRPASTSRDGRGGRPSSAQFDVHPDVHRPPRDRTVPDAEVIAGSADGSSRTEVSMGGREGRDVHAVPGSSDALDMNEAGCAGFADDSSGSEISHRRVPVDLEQTVARDAKEAGGADEAGAAVRDESAGRGEAVGEARDVHLRPIVPVEQAAEAANSLGGREPVELSSQRGADVATAAAISIPSEPSAEPAEPVEDLGAAQPPQRIGGEIGGAAAGLLPSETPAEPAEVDRSGAVEELFTGSEVEQGEADIDPTPRPRRGRRSRRRRGGGS